MKIVVLAISLLLSACSTPQWHKQLSGRVEDPRLAEISGLAATARPGEWWVHNDGKHPPELHRINEDGRLLDSVTLLAVDNHDWEDIAAFRFQRQSWLVIGDIGDNFGKRPSIQLYFLPEPASGARSATIRHRLELQYPDGPRDCESLAVDRQTGHIYLLSKRDHPARLYRIPLAVAMRAKRAILEFVGEVDSIPPHNEADITADPEHGRWSDQPNAMDISADGRLIALQSYKMAMIYTRRDGQSVLSALQQSPQKIITGLQQEEAIAFSIEGDYLLVGTEKIPADLLRIDLRGPRSK